MSFLIFILILGMIWFFILGPFLKLIRVSRFWRDAAERMRHPHQPRESEKPKKKIDPNVGEYVEFTETTASRSNQQTGETTVETEQQVEDVSWEDLPKN